MKINIFKTKNTLSKLLFRQSRVNIASKEVMMAIYIISLKGMSVNSITLKKD